MKTVKVKKAVFHVGDTAAELEAGSWSPSPDSVGTEEIMDHGVHAEDLDEEINERLDALDDGNVVSEDELEDVWAEAMHQAGLDIDISQ